MILFLELLQVALGNRDRLSRVPLAGEWGKLFVIAQQQAVAGVCFSGIEALPQDQWPPQEIKLQWYGQTCKIEEQNKQLDKNSAKVLSYFDQEGFKGCILKGQGNALIYPKPERRQSGDIDIWLMPYDMDDLDFGKSRRAVINYVLGKYPNQVVQIHHIEFPKVGDAEVEVHFFPIYLKNPFHHKRLLAYFKEHASEQFENKITTHAGDELIVPTKDFNIIFQLVHVYLHYLFQGIGMRQIIDYYYVLKSDVRCKKEEVMETLWSLGMMKFAKAMMWVQKEVLGLEDKYLFADCDEKEGKRLLDEIMAMGNFGKYDTKYWKGRTSGLIYGLQKMRRQLHFLKEYPQEIMWDPYFRVKLFCAMRGKY